MWISIFIVYIYTTCVIYVYTHISIYTYTHIPVFVTTAISVGTSEHLLTKAMYNCTISVSI